jgi:hypothetical protein
MFAAFTKLKRFTRGRIGAIQFAFRIMKHLLLACLAAMVLLSAPGCHWLRKSKKPKESPAIATDVEADFRQRWVDHRVAELIASGTDSTTANEQAAREFQERYPYIREPKKKK